MQDIYDFENNSNFKYIVHLADIHIPNSTYRKNEFEQVFDNLLNTIRNNKNKRSNTLIVIAGDIFDKARHEQKLSPNAIALFKYLISGLVRLGKIVIIPGNHDNNITYQSKGDETKIDALTSVLTENKNLDKNIFYLRNTGIYKLGNTILYHTSVFDIDKINRPEQYKERLKFLQIRLKEYTDSKHIGILHCGIQSNENSHGFVLKNYAYCISDLEQYDITLLGDTHEQQFLGKNKNIAYPNSLIQQNHGEKIGNHGYILWNMENNTGEFISVPNDFGYITIDDSNYNNVNYPKKSRIKFKYECSKDIDIDYIRRIIEDKTEIITFKEERIILDDNCDSNNAIEHYENSQEYIEYIASIYEQNSEEYQYCRENYIKDIGEITNNNERLTCIPIRLKVNNFQKYTGEHILFEFSNYMKNSTISIGGANASGKSTILRALSYAIWGKDKSVVLDSYVSWGEKKTRLEFEFNYDGELYKITREITKNKNGNAGEKKLILEKYVDGEWFDKTGDHKNHTKDLIVNMFGELKHAKNTWLCEQNSSIAFIDDKDNYEIFIDLLGINQFTNIYNTKIQIMKEINNKIKKLKGEIGLVDISNDNLIQEIGTLNNQLKGHKDNISEKNALLLKEGQKKNYGTIVEYNQWKDKLNQNETKIREISINDISDKEYNYKKDKLENNLDSLYKDRDKLLHILPGKPDSIDCNINIGDIQNELILIETELSNLPCNDLSEQFQNINDKLITYNNKKEQYQRYIEEIEQFECDINNITILDEGEAEEYGKKLTKYKTMIERFKEQITNHDEISFQRDLLNKRIKLISENIEKISEYISAKSLSIMETSETDEIIQSKYQHLKTMNKYMGELIIKKDLIKKDLDNNNNLLSQFINLKFNNTCKCCENNKNFYKIDIFEQKSIVFKQSYDALLLEIVSLEIEIEKYLKYEKLNSDIFLKTDIENNRSKLNSLKIELENCEKKRTENEEYFKFCKNKKSIDAKILKYQTKLDLNSINIGKKKEIANNIVYIKNKISKLQYLSSEHETLNKRYNEIKHILSIKDRQLKLKRLLDDSNLCKKYSEINTEIEKLDIKIKNIKEKLGILQIKYNKYLDKKSEIVKIRNNIDLLSSNIEKYEKHGGYCDKYYHTLNKSINNIENEKDSLILELGEKRNKLEQYNQNIILYNEYNEKIERLETEKCLLEIYIKTIDPSSGYPIDLIKKYIKLFNKKVNEFIKFLGFDYKTIIEIPKDRRSEKKLCISHIKNNNKFTELSGAEYFTYKIAILTSLGYLTNISVPMLIIDEGMSCLDEDHIGEIPRLLNFMKKQFNYIIYISHNKYLIQKSDYTIKVS